MGDDIFERRDEETNEVVGYAFFNIQKRKTEIPLDIVVDVPLMAWIPDPSTLTH